MSSFYKYISFALFFAVYFAACKRGDNPNHHDDTPVIHVDSNVYIAGSTIADNGYLAATYWKNGAPVVIAKSATSQVDAIAVQDTDVYAAGYYFVSPHFVAVYWKNGIPVEIASPTEASMANAIALNGKQIYIAGSKRTSTIYGNEATFWNNDKAIKLEDRSIGSDAFGMAIKGNDIYVAGEMAIPKYAIHAVYWKNGVPVILPHGDALWSSANAIAIHNNDVYVVGYATSHTGEKHVARYWKNGVMTTLADTLQNSQVLSITFKGDDFYIAGSKETSKNIDVPVIWKNGIAQTLDHSFANGMSAMATSVAFKGNDTCITGAYLTKTQYMAGYWKNGTFTQLKGNGDRGAFVNAVIIK